MQDGSGNACRILLKLSGEVLAGPLGTGFHGDTLDSVAMALIEVQKAGYQLGVVTGGGNLARGRELGVFTRTRADYMGMLATVMNGLALSDVIRKHGGSAAVLSALGIPEADAPRFSVDRAEELFAQGSIVVFAGGTGNPLFSTDTAAALRAAQTRCRMLYKGTKVDGVYTSDPKIDTGAVRFDRISYGDVLHRKLEVMDPAAVLVCRDNSIPVVVFDVTDPLNFSRVLADSSLGTVIE